MHFTLRGGFVETAELDDLLLAESTSFDWICGADLHFSTILFQGGQPNVRWRGETVREGFEPSVAFWTTAL